MTPMFKGILWLAGILLCWGLANKSHADSLGDLNTLLEGKVQVYEGTCHLTKQGRFAHPKEEYIVRVCNVYVDREGTQYALILYQSAPVKLLRIKNDGADQDVIWTRSPTT